MSLDKGLQRTTLENRRRDLSRVQGIRYPIMFFVTFEPPLKELSFSPRKQPTFGDATTGFPA